MRKLAIILLSATVLSSVALGADNDIVATYKTGDGKDRQEVKESQVMLQFKPALDMNPANKDKKFTDLDGNIQEALVKGYINFKLLNQEIVTQGIKNSPSFKEKLSKSEDQLAQQELVENYVKNNVTDKMIDAEYDKLAANMKGKKEIKVSHILVDSEEKAKEIKKKLGKGGKFATLAKESSSDEGSKANGGEIGYVIKGQLVPEFEDKAFAMKPNEISDPVKTQFGWHIIKVSDIRDAKVPTKEEAKGGISDRLSREAVEKYFTDLANKADIKLTLPKKNEPKAVAPGS